MRRYLLLSSTTASFAICLFGLSLIAQRDGVHSAELKGNPETCDVSGESIELSDALKMKCFHCTCKNGFVECKKKECPSIEGCHVLEDPKLDQCCAKCKGCWRDGVYYESGRTWTAAKNPCRSLTCFAGIITESPIRCYTPCDDPIPPEPGQCCSTCPDCQVNGRYIKDMQPVMPKKDPCVIGNCTAHVLTCTKKTCPVLNCPPSKLVNVSGECCPRCLGTGKYMNPPKGACLFSTTVYQQGAQFSPDDCAHCVCENSTLICEKKSCPILDCDYRLQETLPGRCCAQCRAADDEATTADEVEISDNDNDDDEKYELKVHEGEANGSCAYGDKTYANGATWNTTKCEACICNRGAVKCTAVLCPAINCSSNLMLSIPDGQCCPICTESQGVCSVFGGTHFRTFDGKMYAFIGSCKYELARDCDSETFNVRLKNNVVGNDVSMKRITLRFGALRVDLQHSKHTKVNDEIVDLPYRSDDNLLISGSDESVMVATKMGIKLQWNYVGLFEVTVPKRYKRKLCGLCGNFNSSPDDDLITREGIPVGEPTVFAQSWTVGDDDCFDTRKYGVRACDPEKNKRLCNYIKGSVFGKCLRKLNVTSYYDNCLKDVCQCTPDDLQCHCESFASYVRDCRRLGILLPRWRKSVGC